MQTEKLAGLGQMVAGVAHEINNPLSFVSNNVAILQRDGARPWNCWDSISRPSASASAPRALEHADLLAPIHDLGDRIDLPYTLENIPDLFGRTRGRPEAYPADRRRPARFARLDESDLHDVDLNEGVGRRGDGRGRATGKDVRIDLEYPRCRPSPATPPRSIRW